MEANRNFEVFPPSVLQMLRSARSHLRRHSGSEDAESSRAKNGAEAPLRRRSSDVNGSRSQRLPRPSLGQAVGSENVAPEKAQAPPSSTNILGDATNTYSNVSGRIPFKAADFPVAVKPETVQQLPPPVALAPLSTYPQFNTSEGSNAGAAPPQQQPENPQHVKEYEEDIFQVLSREELRCLPSANYMEKQVHVNAKMRAILVDWLVDVNKKYKLRSETLFLAVQLIDRYLDVQVTAKSQLQLVGATCLLIAAKFEEIYPPQIKEFEYITDKAYTRTEILKMEGVILKSLNFKLCCPTAMAFLEKYQSANGCTDSHRALAQYLLELTLVDYKMLKYTPSHLAAASILLSNKLLRQPSWPLEAAKQTRMTEQMLKECAKEMCGLLEWAETSSLQAVRRKFSAAAYHAVAKLNFTDRGPSGTATSTSSAPRAAARRSSTGAI